MKAPAEFTFSTDKPIIFSAVHAGSFLSKACKSNIALDKATRLREEDPFTDDLARTFPNNIIVNYSRFEFDVNRKRDDSFYLKPEDAWDLEVRKDTPEKSLVDSSLRKYDDFYDSLYKYFIEIQQKFNSIFVFDIHSYNHRRNGPDNEPSDQEKNPDIIIGTGNMPEKWAGLTDKLIKHFSQYKIGKKNLDVRKNVKFSGGWFSYWLHYTFPSSVCCVSIEFKKIFMDEWTGKLDQAKFNVLKKALEESFPIIEKHLENT